ncbi:uncharacterized protein H6S33_010441 [Morchella sextelata]|uniref:uncharacterized protein n=1 Tax=Morchella sextelata TaxID=1174677 RepID=UPI001D03F838|nr:uncharacterized protein H6S33_010441 [Morchella sextelata]KAH0612389.1 hypothetical protein H6S33_010441 [Morchella sextelata]
MSAPLHQRKYDQQSIPIEVDPLLEGDSDATSSTSDYESGSTYAFPNDETEQERLDIIHHTYSMLIDDKLHLAPIGLNPQRILDIGTGTGIWAIDVAERYPSAEVIGTDLSPIRPSWHVYQFFLAREQRPNFSRVPPNVSFQIDDAESEWTFGESSFDFVHMRHLNGSIKDWQALLNQAFK